MRFLALRYFTVHVRILKSFLYRFPREGSQRYVLIAFKQKLFALNVFGNAWQNPVKWLLRARQIRSTLDANMEHAGEGNSTWLFRFRVAQVCSLSFQIKFGNTWQNPLSWPLRDIEIKSTSAAIFTFRWEKSINFSLYKQGTDARRLHYFYGLLFKNKG